MRSMGFVNTDEVGELMIGEIIGIVVVFNDGANILTAYFDRAARHAAVCLPNHCQALSPIEIGS